MTSITAICPACGITFAARSVLAVYCTVTCKCRAAYYRRQGRPIPTTKQTFNRPQPIRPQVLQPEIIDEDAHLPEWARASMPPAGTEERFWQGTAIQRREADGFVNATAMCQANGKRWAKYAESERCKEYTQALEAVVRNPDFEIVQSQRGGQHGGGSTWIHPSLAIDLARWISPAFAVWMDGWFLESLTRPAQPSLVPGIHVVAETKRAACQLWHDAVQAEVKSAIAYQLSPMRKTEFGVRMMCNAQYRFTPAT